MDIAPTDFMNSDTLSWCYSTVSALFLSISGGGLVAAVAGVLWLLHCEGLLRRVKSHPGRLQGNF